MGFLRIWRINRFYIINFLSAFVLFNSVLTNTDVYDIYFGKLNITSAFTVIFSVGFILFDVLFLTDSLVYYLIPSNEIRVRNVNLTKIIIRKTIIDSILIIVRSLIILTMLGRELKYAIIINALVTIVIFLIGNVLLKQLTVDKRVLVITFLIIVLRLI